MAKTERKKKEGKQLQMVQDRDGDMSSSDEERLGKDNPKTKRAQVYEACEYSFLLLSQSVRFVII